MEESLIELEFVGSSTYYEAYQQKQNPMALMGRGRGYCGLIHTW